MENKYLIIVDMQNDFIDGSLGTKEAQQMIPVAVKRIEELKKQNFKVIATMDSHHDADYLNTQEGKRLPVKHCILGTKGWQMNKQIRDAVWDHQMYLKPTFGCFRMAEDLANEGMNNPDTIIEIIGLCTDICVVSNALILKANFLKSEIIVDSSCCAGVTPETHNAALQTMRCCQINII